VVKVFVAVGTTEFDALIREMDALIPALGLEATMQIGHGGYEPRHCPYFRFAPSLEPYYDWADVVVAHGGFGTTMEVLHKGKKLISLSNPDRYDEHQSDLLGTLEAEGYLAWCREPSHLPDLLRRVPEMQFRRYEPPDCRIHTVIADYLARATEKPAAHPDRTVNHIRQLVEKHFDTLAPTYDLKADNRRAYLDGVDARIIAHLSPLGPGLTVLDVGCGTGKRTAGLKARLPGSRFFACDLSAQMLKAARSAPLDGLSQQTMTALGYAANTFDAVLCLFNTLGYLATPTQRGMAMAEFARVLRPGGWLLVDVMNLWHLGEGLQFRRSLPTAIWEALIAQLRPDIGPGNKYFTLNINGHCIPGFVHGFTDGEMRRLLRQAGLEVVHSEIIGYDTGQTRRRLTQGQLFYIARKPQ
jgi:ubiquinone/menaquinone biosynthesis C-methylase UbiE/UDP-N-acetylglucosamine transferase subunit ALG13